ncbi:uncharacterized protein BCR38DRAFT_91730 [Pseudomassariella vexata]|uniref:Uncharacterized protein n=1 Tax=Pseudomassariella vexata TaxID=1141098 RepID=A0A1Y2EDW0_9PEZI|nr:uncharacterized protein BCR38DRAFT_91730 [Pseudomassariella vexata]ORY69750.1 hypothetical protein BCR38DRAFT_91730 [Pseudomassariella vexata]
MGKLALHCSFGDPTIVVMRLMAISNACLKSRCQDIYWLQSIRAAMKLIYGFWQKLPKQARAKVNDPSELMASGSIIAVFNSRTRSRNNVEPIETVSSSRCMPRRARRIPEDYTQRVRAWRLVMVKSQIRHRDDEHFPSGKRARRVLASRASIGSRRGWPR